MGERNLYGEALTTEGETSENCIVWRFKIGVIRSSMVNGDASLEENIANILLFYFIN